MFISFHHCGELVGDPSVADGKARRTVREFESSRLLIDENPARISLTARALITHVSPTERSRFFDVCPVPPEIVVVPPTLSFRLFQSKTDARANRRCASLF